MRVEQGSRGSVLMMGVEQESRGSVLMMGVEQGGWRFCHDAGRTGE